MISSRLQFQLDACAADSRARAATFQTLHNIVQTPLFMPVGTQATVKAQLPEFLEESGSQILLANTYHLLLRPGPEVFTALGGIHEFMCWKKSVLTDSGGYQIFSLPHSRSMNENGAVFQSYVDGKTILLSPERSIETQRAINSDIMMVLDQCIPATANEKAAQEAVEITQRWAKRSLDAHGDSPQALFAIAQGALYPELRRQSVEGLVEMEFDGFAIGGLAVGEEKHEREDMCEFTAQLLPEDRPRYLMGVGTPLDIMEAVHRGMDMFDCIIPTQVAKRGTLFTSRGLMQMRRSVYKFSDQPTDPSCACPTCRKYSRAYLHHLTKTQEPLGWQLMGQHNIWFYHQLMREMRGHIIAGTFENFYREQREILGVEDLEHPVLTDPPSRKKPSRVRELGAYEVHESAVGFCSIRHRASGEIMHSHTPPYEEAQALYVEQSRLAHRVREVQSEPMVVWDVGLGAAANAMAAVNCYEMLAETGPVRELQIVSFENDLDSLRLALRHKKAFPYLRHSAPDAVLARGEWRSRRFSGLSWNLWLGDFESLMPQATPFPDVIFYDMFSNRTQGEAWTVAAFEKLFAKCGHRAVEIFTYSTATAVRVAMLAAGFHVARGRGTGAKTETTIALTPAAAQGTNYALLDAKWLEKWHRSHAKYPESLSESERGDFEQRILQHAQFRNSVV